MEFTFRRQPDVDAAEAFLHHPGQREGRRGGAGGQQSPIHNHKNAQRGLD